MSSTLPAKEVRLETLPEEEVWSPVTPETLLPGDVRSIPETLPQSDVRSPPTTQTLLVREVRSKLDALPELRRSGSPSVTLPERGVRSQLATLPETEVWSPRAQSAETLPFGEVRLTLGAVVDGETQPQIPEGHPYRAKKLGCPWGNRPRPLHLTARGRKLAHLAKLARAKSDSQPGASGLVSHPLADVGEDHVPTTRVRILGRRVGGSPGATAAEAVPASPTVAPPWHQRHPPVVKKLQYAEHLADSGGRVKAWHWRRARNTLPLEEAVNRVRRALRESPAAARALVDKMTARTRNFAHTRGIRLHTRAAALRTLIQQLQTAMDVEQGMYSAAGRQHHTPLASVPSENLGFAADLCSAWSELSPAEQRQAVRSSPPSSRPGTRPWEQLGLARLRARRHGMWLQSGTQGADCHFGG